VIATRLKKEIDTMKVKRILGWASALSLSAGALQAQEATALDQVQKQMKQLQENFDRIVKEQQRQIESLNQQLDELRKGGPNTNAAPATAQPGGPTKGVPESKPWSPSDPIRLGGNQQNFLNISFDGLFAAGWSSAEDVESLQLGGHDPKQRGFTVQNLEATFDGKIDPYFRGQANIVLQIDPEGETTVEAEEAYLETMSLPWNLQVKAGQYFSEFGRLNPTHPHIWDFVDQPLVNGRFFGEDGLRNPGARVSWLVPTPFYSELFFGVQNSQGETAFSFRDTHEDGYLFGRPAEETRVKGFGDLLYVPRYAASFNLTDEQTIVLGASGALGPNASGKNTDTQIYGADLFYKWKSRNHSKGFPFVTWQTEWLYRRYEAAAFGGDGNQPIALPAENLRDWGLYSQLSYGFHRGWVASLRGDYVTGDKAAFQPDPDRDTRWRISPALTFYPSEFSKIRLQYNYDDRENVGTDHSIWLQFEFLLGAHAAHKF
jgi:hypothetical protein